MARKVHLEGSLIVEMQTGEERMLTRSPYKGHVYHLGDNDDLFAPPTITPEDDFRRAMKRVVSRSSYDRR